MPKHHISTAFELGWADLSNGELLQRAELSGFEVLVTTDQNLRYQQNLSGRHIGIVVLSGASWPRIQRILPQVIEAIESIRSSGYVEVAVPYLS